MDIQSIASEQHLRHWLSERIAMFNQSHISKVRLDWIEPTFGSSMGIPDAKISYKGTHYEVELKHLLMTRRGVHYKIRPVQRRYHKMGFKEGKRVLILATINNNEQNELIMIRGDRVPLRDYCSIEGSGCENGIVQTRLPDNSARAFEHFLITISDSSWWLPLSVK